MIGVTFAAIWPVFLAEVSGGDGQPGAILWARLKPLFTVAVCAALAVVSVPQGLLPYGYNLIAHPVEASWSVRVVSTMVGTGSKGCQWEVTVRPDDPAAYKYSLCLISHEIVEEARPGDRLILIGPKGPFGMTYRTAKLLPAAARG